MARALAAVAGALAVGLGLGLAEFAAGLLPEGSSLVLAIGALVIDHQPTWGKELMLALFGDYHKPALSVAIALGATGIGSALGVIGLRHFLVAVTGFSGLAAFGMFAAFVDPLAEPRSAVLSAIVGLTSASASFALLRSMLRSWTSESPIGALPISAMPDWERRRFVIAAGGMATSALALGTLGRLLLERGRNTSPPGLHVSAPPAPEYNDGTSFDIPGLGAIVTPNHDFYRVDVNLLVPRVDLATWKLRVTGMVDQELSLDYEELAAMPQVRHYVTLACVSNKVGGHLIGNASWTGVRLRDLLESARVHPEATQIVGRAVDRWTAGFPLAYGITPERETIVALRMNDEPLPVEHGFPARLIVPGLFGYVSATKWLAEIELTTMEAFDAYWIRLGWAKEAPVLIQSRIDVPRHGRIQAGENIVAGVAWAPDRGIGRVEVSVDEGPWRDAEITEPLSNAAWIQWKLQWTALRGHHTLTVRATDRMGEVQTAHETDPFPDGARGHHTIVVTAE